MVWVISIILVILMYYGVYYLYRYYKSDINDLEKELLYLKKKIGELERKEMINAKLLNWLYDELTRKNLLNLEKENKESEIK